MDWVVVSAIGISVVMFFVIGWFNRQVNGELWEDQYRDEYEDEYKDGK